MWLRVYQPTKIYCPMWGGAHFVGFLFSVSLTLFKTDKGHTGVLLWSPCSVCHTSLAFSLVEPPCCEGFSLDESPNVSCKRFSLASAQCLLSPNTVQSLKILPTIFGTRRFWIWKRNGWSPLKCPALHWYFSRRGRGLGRELAWGVMMLGRRSISNSLPRPFFYHPRFPNNSKNEPIKPP